MIFKIVDGRPNFYQWDINRQIAVSDPTITELHFCNRTDVCSLVVAVENGIANVPNILLQSGFSIRVFGYDGQATLHEATFEVKARTKPTDYVYTETEIKQYSDLEKRIDEIEQNGISEEVITGAVENYLDEHPINLEGYATEQYVNEAVFNVKVDLTGYATESYVDEAVKNVEVDLTDYAKKTDIPDVSSFISSIPAEYITESELSSKGYATKTELNDKANTNHTHSEYAKTKHTHDMADVNGLQNALSAKASQSDIEKAIELHNHNDLYAAKEHNHDEKYSSKGHVHSYNDLTNKPEIPSVEGLATEAYVDKALETINNITNGDVVTIDINCTVEEFLAVVESGRAVVLTETTVSEGNFSINATDYFVLSNANKSSPNSPRYTFTRISKQNGLFQTNQKVATINFDNSPATISWTSGYVGIQERIYFNMTPAADAEVLTSFRAGSKDYIISSGGSADLSNYYTKEETTQAIQDALNAIGVAEGGAY